MHGVSLVMMVSCFFEQVIGTAYFSAYLCLLSLLILARLNPFTFLSLKAVVQSGNLAFKQGRLKKTIFKDIRLRCLIMRFSQAVAALTA
jgi:hypothetical protein